MNSKHRRVLWPFVLALSGIGSAFAHHTYAMFDGTATRTVSGTVAKLEWKNPHVFLWVYVPSRENAGKYDLYAFENGSPSVLSDHGWTPTVLKPGDKVTIAVHCHQTVGGQSIDVGLANVVEQP